MENNNTLVRDLTQGSIMGQLIRYSLPLMAANALQVCFNLVDILFVGQFAGTNAQAACNIGGQFTTLMFFCFMGLGVAGQICTAQAVGRANREEIGSYAGNTITLSILCSVLLMIVIPLCTPILRLMDTPEEIFSETSAYLIICTAGNPIVALYNSINSVLRGLGDSRHPTLFVIVASLVNVVLDYLFVGPLQWGAPGAALATVIGQCVACICAVVFLSRKRSNFGFDFSLRSFILQKQYASEILRIGIPIALKNVLISLSNLLVNKWINGFGPAAIAVTGVCQKLQSLMTIISQAMSDAAATMVGQCLGSGKSERIKGTVRNALLFSLAYAAFLALIFLLFPTQVFSLFSRDAEVIGMAPKFMMVCALNVFFGALMSPTMGMINGMGDTVYNLFVGIADGLIGRIAFSVLFGFVLNMGALGFFLGSCLAASFSVIGGGIYFFGGWWKKKVRVPDGASKSE